jgi:hypothetical protein
MALLGEEIIQVYTEVNYILITGKSRVRVGTEGLFACTLPSGRTDRICNEHGESKREEEHLVAFKLS